MGAHPSKRFDLSTTVQNNCQSNSDCNQYYNTTTSNVCNNVACDPNLGSCACMDNDIITGTQVNSNGFSCSADTDCMHINEELSRPNKIVYACPNAKCNSGTCSCDPDCVFDSYSGLCCQGLITVSPGSDSFCVMQTKKPFDPTMFSTFVPMTSFATSVPMQNKNNKNSKGS